MSMLRRYGLGARVYDAVSGERFVYRVGRVAGVAALRLKPGDTVLDLGCGTGLNLPLIIDRVGPTGLVVGVDRSTEMLRMARRRVARHAWRNVRLLQADVADLSSADLVAHAAPADRAGQANQTDNTDETDQTGNTDETGETDQANETADLSPAHVERIFDAALSTYAMSVFGDWRPAWTLMRSTLAPGGRIAIVDMARPTGFGALLTPIAVLACAVGGADIDAAPWRVLAETGSDVTHSIHRSGHIHVVAGSYP